MGSADLRDDALRLLAEDAGLSALALEPDLTVSAFGPLAASLFLLSAGELRGARFERLVAPESQADAMALLVQARTRRVRRELSLRRGDGTTFFAQLFAGPREGGTLVLVRDLAEPRSLEAEAMRLRERERAARAEAERQRDRLHSLLEDAPALIGLTRGPDHVVLFLSNAARALGQGRDVVGRRLKEALRRPGGEGILEIAEAVFKTGTPVVSTERRLVLPRGEGGAPQEGWFDFICRPTRDSDGGVDGLLFFGIEVTAQVLARQKAETAAQVTQAQQEWLEEVLDLMPTPLVLVEPESARLTFANKAARALAGGDFLASEAFEPQHQGRLTDSEGNAVSLDDLPAVRAARGEPVDGVQFDWHLPDGSVRSLLFSAALLPAAHGHRASVVMPFLDVTQLKRVEAQLQRAVAARDEFLSIASHELRTPLTSLQLELQALQRRLARGAEEPAVLAPDQIERSLETSVRQVQRLAKLVHNLLDLSRLTSGRIDLELSEVDLAEVAREVVARSRAEAERAGCTLTYAGDGARVVGEWDRLRLEQVAVNLISNAIKYGGGRPIEVSVEADEARARLRVKDRGIGIAPEDQARIFDRFERAVSERHYGGFGLGLWIVRQIVHALQGGIWVQSKVGEGAAFTVELPRKRLATTPPRAVGAPPGIPSPAAGSRKGE